MMDFNRLGVRVMGFEAAQRAMRGLGDAPPPSPIEPGRSLRNPSTPRAGRCTGHRD